MEQFLVFMAVVAVFVGGLYFYAATKISFNPVVLWKHLQKSGANFGITGVVILGGVIALVLLLIYPKSAHADDVNYFKYTTLYLGLDQDITNHGTGAGVFCHKGDINDRITSNVGVMQHLVGYKDIEIMAKYTHHSCALNKDQPTYDAIGLVVQWTFRR